MNEPSSTDVLQRTAAPRLSVIIITGNEAANIGECLDCDASCDSAAPRMGPIEQRSRESAVPAGGDYTQQGPRGLDRGCGAGGSGKPRRALRHAARSHESEISTR